MALLHPPRHRRPLRKDDVENPLPVKISHVHREPSIPTPAPHQAGGDLDGEEGETLRPRL